MKQFRRIFIFTMLSFFFFIVVQVQLSPLSPTTFPMLFFDICVEYFLYLINHLILSEIFCSFQCVNLGKLYYYYQFYPLESHTFSVNVIALVCHFLIMLW